MDPGLLPRRCVLCRTAGPGLCRDCARSLPSAPHRTTPPGLDGCAALLRYDGPTPALIGALKYRNHRDAVPLLARALAMLLPELLRAVPAEPPRGRAQAGGPPPSCVLTWAPTSADRVRRRGFDQAEVLSRHTARAASVRAVPLLRRLPGPPQTGRDRLHRVHGPAFASRAAPAGTVVVVDDVWTTGATLMAAARNARAGPPTGSRPRACGPPGHGPSPATRDG